MTLYQITRRNGCCKRAEETSAFFGDRLMVRERQWKIATPIACSVVWSLIPISFSTHFPTPKIYIHIAKKFPYTQPAHNCIAICHHNYYQYQIQYKFIWTIHIKSITFNISNYIWHITIIIHYQNIFLCIKWCTKYKYITVKILTPKPAGSDVIVS